MLENIKRFACAAHESVRNPLALKFGLASSIVGFVLIIAVAETLNVADPDVHNIPADYLPYAGFVAIVNPLLLTLGIGTAGGLKELCGSELNNVRASSATRNNTRNIA